jgi:hypothetical protein
MKKEKKQTQIKQEESKTISAKEFDSAMKTILSTPPIEKKKDRTK